MRIWLGTCFNRCGVIGSLSFLKLKFSLLVALACAVLTSCDRSNKLALWVAKENVKVYESPETGKIVFTIDVGDVCTPGDEKIMKDYQYTEMLCTKGYGWIIVSDHVFDIIRKPKSR